MVISLGIDRSHFNAEPDFPVFKAAGGTFVLCKGTEGSTFKDPTFDACRVSTHAAGLAFGSYHFARWGDPATEALFYLASVTPRPGELVALDVEAAVPPGVDVVAWCTRWSQLVKAATGAAPLIYMNQTWLGAHNWAPVLAVGDGLWLAKYDGLPSGGPTGTWPFMAMKQFTDRAQFPGEAGAVDEDAFEGDLAALLRYAVPTPAPTPEDPLATLTQDQANALVAQNAAMYGWLKGAKNSGNPAGYDNVYLLWTMLGSALTALTALQADLTEVKGQVAALQATPPGTAEIAAAVVQAVDADLARRFDTPVA